MSKPPFAREELFYLYGEDPTPGVVGMSPVFSEDKTEMKIWIRDPKNPQGDLQTDLRRFYPFFFLSDKSVLEPFERGRYRFLELEGENFYEYLVVTPEWSTHSDLLDRIYMELGYPPPEETDEYGNPDYDHRKIEEIYVPGSMQTMFQMQSGITYFKGLSLEDICRMQIDIEVYSSTQHFPDPERDGDEIIIVSACDKRGGSWLITQECGKARRVIEDKSGADEVFVEPDEAALLTTVENLIRVRDPDVLEGFNFFEFDLDYMAKRAERYAIPFLIGRDSQEMYRWESSRSFAEKDIEYPMASVPGRSVIDAYHLVLDYDVFAREMSSHGLKASAKHFGVEGGDGSAEDRTYVEGDKISDYWEEDPLALFEYAMDDVYETRALAEILSESSFYQAQVLPMSYTDAERKGTATIIETLFAREYLRQRVSIPRPDDGVQSSGGYTDIYMRGVFDHLVYADVSSLYPAIMTEYKCTPGEKDPIDFFERSLRQLLDMRLEMKKEMRALEDEVEEDKKKLEEQETNPDMPPQPGEVTPEKVEEKEARIELLDAKQSSYKILINSYYGAMGFSVFSWNAIDEADRVADTGQALLKKMIAEIEKDGGRIIEVDTDGVIFQNTSEMDLPRKTEAEAEYVRELTQRMPEGIEIDHDGSFQRVISLKKKNYALLGYDEDPSEMKVKGSSLISRSNEKFGRDFVDEVLQALMRKDIQEMHDIYCTYYDRIVRSDWSPDEFSRTQDLKETFEEYREKVKIFEEQGHGNGGHTKQARFEVAIRDEERGRAEYGIGDSVSWYVAHGRENSVTGRAKHVSQYEGDEDTEYYVDRLNTFAKKFEPFFEKHHFRQIFSPDNGLFGFDSSGIAIKNSRVRPPLRESESVKLPKKPKRSVPA